MTDQPKVEFELTAADKTDKGATSAEKRMEKAVKRVGQLQRKSQDETTKGATRAGRAISRTFADVEKAATKVFGGKSITSGLTSRLGGITKAASALGDGFGEASAAGTALEATVGAVGVAVAGTVAVMAAAAYGAFKLADGWAKGAASIGRTAEIIGVNTQKLQEFAAAAERVGVDKNTATGAIGGLSQTLNDARYGRNPQALAAISRLGVGMTLNKDGTVNVDAMLPAIADAIARQNSSGRRTAARLLGIPEAALPAFSQGGKALSGDMSSAATTAPLITDADVTVGKRMLRRHVMAQQRVERETLTRAGRAAAGGLDSVESEAISLFSGSVTEDFKPGARQIKEAAGTIGRAATSLAQAVSPIAAAQAAERKWGVPAAITLGQYQLESGGGAHMPPGSNNPFGIKAKGNEPFVWAWTHEQDRFGVSRRVRAKFRKFSSIGEAFDAHARLLATAKVYAPVRDQTTDEGWAEALQGRYATDKHYASKLESTIHHHHFSDYDKGEIPVKVDVSLSGFPAGSKAKVTAGRSAKPAVSHAFSDR